MIGLERIARAVALLFSQAEEALDRRSAVRAVLPFTDGAPVELRRFGRVCQCGTGTEQRFDIDTVVDRGCCRGHRSAPCCFSAK